MSDGTQAAFDFNVWADVPNWEGFSVTEGGLIKGPSGKVLSPMRHDSGHLFVTRGRKSKKLYVHQAVLLAFEGPPLLGQEGRHLNGQPADNRRENLKWGDRYDQRDDDHRNGVSHVRWPVLPKEKLKEIHEARGAMSSRVVARQFGLSHTTILRFWRGLDV